MVSERWHLFLGTSCSLTVVPKACNVNKVRTDGGTESGNVHQLELTRKASNVYGAENSTLGAETALSTILHHTAALQTVASRFQRAIW